MKFIGHGPFHSTATLYLRYFGPADIAWAYCRCTQTFTCLQGSGVRGVTNGHYKLDRRRSCCLKAHARACTYHLHSPSCPIHALRLYKSHLRTTFGQASIQTRALIRLLIHLQHDIKAQLFSLVCTLWGAPLRTFRPLLYILHAFIISKKKCNCSSQDVTT